MSSAPPVVAPPVPQDQNKKTPQPGLLESNGVCDVFVVGGATAVGYLWGGLSEICANLIIRGEPFASGLAPTVDRERSQMLVLTLRSMWERVCSRRRWVSRYQCWKLNRFREQARSHMWSAVSCGSEPAREGGRPGATRPQPSNSFMAMICSATWISFCWRLMAWRRIRV